ncbi:hypothetical protein ACODT5_28820 [Streptomyces sp. 5.8]|uniref:hypothetical protein n=1 Tax=Streptomyces sp. 5.8 TaxID=3406571 RepID=UPI003BB5FDEA
MTVITSKSLKRALKTACASFAPDELAYLALTSKPESPVRDRLAWTLHTSLPDHVAAREWATNGKRARTDLAILDKASHKPLALIELKACYTFDFADPAQKSVGDYRRRIADDLAKAREAGDADTALFGLLLMTHPAIPPQQTTSVVKYGPDIERSLKARSSHSLAAAARHNALTALTPLGKVKDGTLRAGSAFGIDVDISYFLIRAGEASPQ